MRFWSLSKIALPLAFLGALFPSLRAQTGSTVDWASYVDGSGTAQAMAVAADGGIWVAGSSAAQFDAPGPNDPYQRSPKGRRDAYVAKYQRNASGQVTLVFWTWLGGTGNDDVRAMTLDSQGRVYITGTTDSTDYPTTGFFSQGSNGGAIDVFVSVIDTRFSGADSVVHSSYYGASQNDISTGIAVDSSFNVYVVGYSNSENLPGVSGNAQPGGRGGIEAFLYKLDPASQSTLRYATYFGGKSTDVATGVAIDRNGVAWFTGFTASDDFPVSGTPYRAALQSGFDGFLVGLDTNRRGLDGIQYGTYLGGGGADYPRNLRISPTGTFWITGYTFSPDFPLTANAVQRQLAGGVDGFLMELNLARPPAEALSYSTYLGGDGTDVPYGLTLLEGGRVAISGYTDSSNLRTTAGALQTARNGRSIDGFLAILNPASTALEYSSYVGGGLTDIAQDVLVDGANGIYVCGSTGSSDFLSGVDVIRPNPATGGIPFVIRIARAATTP